MRILDDDESGGESKLEIIEESQEETLPKETYRTTTTITSCIATEGLLQDTSNEHESNYERGNRMKSCLMDDSMSSKEAVESLLLLGSKAVVANDGLDSQTGVCIDYHDHGYRTYHLFSLDYIKVKIL